MPVDHGFEFRWRQHAKPQAQIENQFWPKTGWTRADLAGKTVLDAGCGCGRFSELVASCGGKPVGVDGSEGAIEAARVNCPSGSFQLANLLEPLPVEPVDMAFSIGVLHHTADPRLAFHNVAACVKPGGELAVWVYAPLTNDVMPFMHFLHDITKACPPEALYAACAKHAIGLRDLDPGAWDTLRSVVRVSTSLNDEECISDTFDWHCPQYRSYHTDDEVAGWFREEGFAVNRVGEFITSVRGRRL